jgi:hypothetical protein
MAGGIVFLGIHDAVVGENPQVGLARGTVYLANRVPDPQIGRVAEIRRKLRVVDLIVEYPEIRMQRIVRGNDFQRRCAGEFVVCVGRCQLIDDG